MSRIYCKCCSKGFDTPKEPYYCPHCGADNNSDLADTSVNTPTLRDQFAMSALQGILSSPVMGDSDLHESAEIWLKDITESAYEFADAMLEARK